MIKHSEPSERAARTTCERRDKKILCRGPNLNGRPCWYRKIIIVQITSSYVGFGVSIIGIITVLGIRQLLWPDSDLIWSDQKNPCFQRFSNIWSDLMVSEKIGIIWPKSDKNFKNTIFVRASSTFTCVLPWNVCFVQQKLHTLHGGSLHDVSKETNINTH